MFQLKECHSEQREESIVNPITFRGSPEGSPLAGSMRDMPSYTKNLSGRDGGKIRICRKNLDNLTTHIIFSELFLFGIAIKGCVRNPSPWEGEDRRGQDNHWLQLTAFSERVYGVW